MRSAGNLHPEWGYFAPAPRVMRTMRIAVVSIMVGAISCAVVVVSLVKRPGSSDGNTSIAAHALILGAPVITMSAPSGPEAVVLAREAVIEPKPLLAPVAEPIVQVASTTESTATSAAAQAPLAHHSIKKHHWVARKRWHPLWDRRLIDKYGGRGFCCSWRHGRFN